MNTIEFNQLSFVSGGKEPPGYGKPGGIPGPNTKPVPVGGGRFGAIIGTALWVFSNGMWDLLGPANDDAEFLRNQQSAGGGQLGDVGGASRSTPSLDGPSDPSRPTPLSTGG